MTAITTNNSMSVKPLCRFILSSLKGFQILDGVFATTIYE